MTVGIIGAMEKEIIWYQKLFNLEKSETIYKVWKGTYKDKNIILMESGIGKVNSAATTQYMIDNYKIDFIINSGCAGSLTDEIKVLDTIIGSYVTYHDFQPIRIMNFSTPDEGKILPDNNLVELTENILKENNIKYHLSPICSGDCFVTSSQMRDEIKERTGCGVVDMESASIGHIAKKNNVPFIIIRTISDFSDGVEEQEETAANISATIVKQIIEKI